MAGQQITARGGQAGSVYLGSSPEASPPLAGNQFSALFTLRDRLMVGQQILDLFI